MRWLKELKEFVTEENLAGENLFNACPATDEFLILCSLPAWRLLADRFDIIVGYQKFQG